MWNESWAQIKQAQTVEAKHFLSYICYFTNCPLCAGQISPSTWERRKPGHIHSGSLLLKSQGATLWNSLCQEITETGLIQNGTGQISNPRGASRKAGPQLNTGCCQAHREALPHVTGAQQQWLCCGLVWGELRRAALRAPSLLPSHCSLTPPPE